MSWGTVTYGPFIRGLILADPEEVIPHDALALAQDTEVGPSGEAKQRMGFDEYITTAFASTPPVNLIGEHRFNSTTTRKYALSGVKFYEDVSGIWTDRTGAATLTSDKDNIWNAVSADGVLYFVSLTDGVFRWTAAGGNIAAGDVDARFTHAGCVEYFDNTLWYANTNNAENEIWRTDSDAHTVIGANSFYLTDGPITGMKTLGNMLTVHNEDGIWVFTPGNTTVPYHRQPRRCKIGSQSRRSVAVDSYGIMYFIREEGIYSWNGGENATRISAPLDGSRYWDNVNTARIDYTFTVVNPRKTQVFFVLPYGSSQANNNHLMVWDYDKLRWYGPYQIGRLCGAYFDLLPHFGDYAGLVWKHETGDTDNGTAIAWNMRTSARPPENLTTQHRWISARHHFDRESVDANVTITAKAEELVSKTETITFGDDSDALVTEFTIGSSAIAGSSTSFAVDTELWGWSSGVQIEYAHRQNNVPITVRKVECLYETIDDVPLNKFELGVR